MARPRILVIEDEPSLAGMIVTVLGEEGFSATAISNGAAALAALRRDEPDLIVLDLRLPGLDGLEVCRRLRRGGSSAPVIMLTALDTIPDRVQGLEAGADDYLVKPFALEELLARIRVQLRRASHETERLGVADLILETESRRVHRDGIEIELTAQEFSLLELLMRYPGQVLTRQRILDHVWGYAAAPASNVVDLYVHYLRAKLERGGGSRLIHTVRSVGYVIRA